MWVIRGEWEGDTVPCPCGPSRCTSVHMSFWSHTHSVYPGQDQVASRETLSQMNAHQILVCCKKERDKRVNYATHSQTKHISNNTFLHVCMVTGWIKTQDSLQVRIVCKESDHHFLPNKKCFVAKKNELNSYYESRQQIWLVSLCHTLAVPPSGIFPTRGRSCTHVREEKKYKPVTWAWFEIPEMSLTPSLNVDGYSAAHTHET